MANIRFMASCCFCIKKLMTGIIIVEAIFGITHTRVEISFDDDSGTISIIY